MRGFNRAALAGVVAGLMVTGCNNPQPAMQHAASGSLALSSDDSLLYAVGHRQRPAAGGRHRV